MPQAVSFFRSTLTPSLLLAIFTIPTIFVAAFAEQEFLSLARGRGNDLNMLQLNLILADGSTYPCKGGFSFADREVNPNTGAIQLTRLYPNPGNRLRPGQYGNASALLIPQRTVAELQGACQVAVADIANKVASQAVKPGGTVGTSMQVNQKPFVEGN
jgi:hypothetical protein